LCGLLPEGSVPIIARRVLLSALALVAATAAPAAAHEPAAGASEAELQGLESASLGAEHAAAHAAGRREARRLARLPKSKRRALARRQRRQARAIALQTAGDPAQVGAWTEPPFKLPNYAIHSVLLPTGKVLFWGYPPPGVSDNRGEAAIWSPELGTGPDSVRSVPPPPIDPDGNGPQSVVAAPIYCSGQSLMATGEVLVAGGNRAPPTSDFTGLDTIFTFDPWSETWRRQRSMWTGRWYPSQLLLADGRTMLMGGYDQNEPGGSRTPIVETFHPGPEIGSEGTLWFHKMAERITGLYPHLFTLPNGNVLMAGPGRTDSGIMPVGSEPNAPLFWYDRPPSDQDRLGGSAVLEPGPPWGSWRVTQFGGYPYNDLDDSFATSSAVTIDTIASNNSGWESAAPFQIGRAHQNTILLPDGSKVTIGGGVGFTAEDANWAVDNEGLRRQVELYDPATQQWRLGPAQLEDRSYHSTALLLPDGRVWSAGDDAHGPPRTDGQAGTTETAEIYSPPYLFKGPRPEIVSAPQELGYGEEFEIETSANPPARQGVLVAPGAVTHANDMGQRLVNLNRTGSDPTHLRLNTPPAPGVAPPGWYMLFGLSEDGVPSHASWVKLG
jgi:hypothetical protein